MFRSFEGPLLSYAEFVRVLTGQPFSAVKAGKNVPLSDYTDRYKRAYSRYLNERKYLLSIRDPFGGTRGGF